MKGSTRLLPAAKCGALRGHLKVGRPAGSESDFGVRVQKVDSEKLTPKVRLQKHDHEVGGRGEVRDRAAGMSISALCLLLSSRFHFRFVSLASASSHKNGGRLLNPARRRAGPECVHVGSRLDRLPLGQVAPQGPSPKAVQKWMRTAGRLDADAFEASRDLYRSWYAWCEQTRISRPFGPQMFHRALRGILVQRRSRHVGRGFAGFRLKSGGGG
jgi:hypothetical protein